MKVSNVWLLFVGAQVLQGGFLTLLPTGMMSSITQLCWIGTFKCLQSTSSLAMSRAMNIKKFWYSSPNRMSFSFMSKKMQGLSMLQVISHTSLSQEIIILFIFKIDVRQKGHKKSIWKKICKVCNVWWYPPFLSRKTSLAKVFLCLEWFLLSVE